MNKIFIGFSRGTGISSWAIRLLTSFVKKRMQMKEDKVNVAFAPILLFLSFFGLTKYSKLNIRYNHCFLFYSSEDFNDFMVVDIIENGIVIQPAKIRLDKSTYTVLIESDLDIAKGVRYTSNYLGLRYDYKGVFGAALATFKFVFTGKEDKHIINSPERFLCSEYVTTVINNSDEDFYIGEPMKTYPNLLCELTKADKNFTTLIEKKNLTLDDIKFALKATKQE